MTGTRDRRWVCALCGVLAWTVLSAEIAWASVPGGESDPLNWLRKVTQELGQRHLTYLETTVVLAPGFTQTTVDQVWREPGRRRVERSSNGFDDGLVVVTDAQATWVGLAGVPVVLRLPPDEGVPVSLQDLPQAVEARPVDAEPPGLTMRRIGEERILSHAAHLFLFEMPGRWASRRWFDARSGLLLQEERFDGQGRPIAVTVRSEIESPTEIPDDRFSFVVPAEAQVVEEPMQFLRAVWAERLRDRLSFDPLWPARLPAAYRLDGMEVIRQPGSPVAVLRLVGERRVVSIYQSRSQSEPYSLWIETEQVGVLQHARDGMEIAIVGAADLREAEHILSILTPMTP